jgi:hypothetical protein
MSLSCGMRFIKFTKLEVETLQEGYRNHSSHSVRRRFHAILRWSNFSGQIFKESLLRIKLYLKTLKIIRKMLKMGSN